MFKNYKRKSVEGLSWIMFLAAVLGNTSYALGVLLRLKNYEGFVKTLPWMVGSLGTIACDLTILIQYVCYKYIAKPDPEFLAKQTPLFKRKRAIHDIYV